MLNRTPTLVPNTVQGLRAMHHAADGHAASAFLDPHSSRAGPMVDMGASFHPPPSARKAPAVSVPRALGFCLLIAALLLVGVVQHSGTPTNDFLTAANGGT
jgi:hypothetical protein